MTIIELKRGYEVLPDNNVRFGIRVINTSDYAISDVEVILDYNESLFMLEGNKVQKLGTIPPAVPRTAKFVLKPRGCIHKEEIGAIVIYKDHQWQRHTLEMRAKEVHCVCPFLKEKSITRADFIALSNTGYLEERGLNFEGITVAKLVEFLLHTCKSRLYKVDEFSIENGTILYLAGDALGEKAYYLLTAVVKEYEGVTQVLLRAASDKKHGINGFLNEILDNLRHLVSSASAREIGVIKKEQVINIIDSVVQRTTFAAGDGAASVTIEGSVAQRAELKQDEEKKRLEEERLRKEKEEQERLRREEVEKRERERRAREELEQKAREEAEKKERKKEKAKKEEERLKREKEEERKAREEAEKRETEEQERLQRAEEERLRKKKEEQEKLAKHGNSIGMQFTLIPAGEFFMGSGEDISYGMPEKPVHKVKITNPFYLCTYPVTQAEWKAVMSDNHFKFKDNTVFLKINLKFLSSKPSQFKGDDLPVEAVSWNDVQEFIKKLNAKEGTDKYRLPSEAEWEYACRAGTTTRYSFGDSQSKLGDYVWYSKNSDDKTHPIGQKKPNPWGLYDMHGNVWEWVQDVWHNSHDGAPTNGSAWGSRDGVTRVVRGGGWGSTAGFCRSAVRSHNDPRFRNGSLGFRILKEL